MLASEETVGRLVKLSDLVAEPALLDDFMADLTDSVRGLPADSGRLWTASALDHVERVVRLHDLVFGYPSKETCKALLERIVFKSRRTNIADDLLQRYFTTITLKRDSP